MRFHVPKRNLEMRIILENRSIKIIFKDYPYNSPFWYTSFIYFLFCKTGCFLAIFNKNNSILILNAELLSNCFKSHFSLKKLRLLEHSVLFNIVNILYLEWKRRHLWITWTMKKYRVYIWIYKWEDKLALEMYFSS